VINRERLEEYLGSPPPRSKAGPKVFGVFTFGSLPKDFFSEPDHQLFKGSLKDTDRIVIGRAERFMAIAVRTQEGKFKVVGLRNFVSPVILATAALERDKPSKTVFAARTLAEEVVRKFLMAAKAKDLDGLLKLADVPWYSDGNKIVKDREELRSRLKRTCVDLVNAERVPSDVLGLLRVGEFGDPFAGNRLAIDEVATNDDWVVIVGENGKLGLFFVRVRAGVGKVVGVAG
jgi:hypothetical protein